MSPSDRDYQAAAHVAVLREDWHSGQFEPDDLDDRLLQIALTYWNNPIAWDLRELHAMPPLPCEEQS